MYSLSPTNGLVSVTLKQQLWTEEAAVPQTAPTGILHSLNPLKASGITDHRGKLPLRGRGFGNRHTSLNMPFTGSKQFKLLLPLKCKGMHGLRDEVDRSFFFVFRYSETFAWFVVLVVLFTTELEQ